MSLVHYPQFSAYECTGCHELIEIPLEVVVKGNEKPVSIRHNPENFLIWREYTERLHSTCGKRETVQ